MLRLKRLYGCTIQAADGEAGKLVDTYFDDMKWISRYLVVDTGGWLGGRKVLISPVTVEEVRDEGDALRVGLTKSEVEHSPDINLDKPVSKQQIVELHEYYGWPAYWGGSMTMGTATPGVYPMILAGVDQVEGEMKDGGPSEKYRGDPHLRSTREVTGGERIRHPGPGRRNRSRGGLLRQRQRLGSTLSTGRYAGLAPGSRGAHSSCLDRTSGLGRPRGVRGAEARRGGDEPGIRP